jgi:hypothetical protein
VRAPPHQTRVPERLMELNHPDNVNAHFLVLPRAAVEATHIPLLHSLSTGAGDVWWQLSEADRRAFRVVHFHTVYVAGRDLHKAVADWLRWAAVRQARSEGMTWPEAYEVAHERLIGTVANGGTSTMKTTYISVQRLLRIRLE